MSKVTAEPLAPPPSPESLPATAAVELRSIRVRRGGTEVLHGIDLEIPPGTVAGLLGAEADIEGALSATGLTRFARQRVSRLSGGQRARVSLATALLGSPELLVLDEPTTGLDPVLREELWGTRRGLAEQGATLLVSSHVIEEARYCDTLVLMREGRIPATGDTGSLLRRAAAPDVNAAFLRLVEASPRREGRERPEEAAGAQPAAETFRRIGVPLLGILPFMALFLVTSVALLRERISGTLERLMTMPVARIDAIAGYAAAFTAMAAAGIGDCRLLDTADGHPAVYGHTPGPEGAPTVLLYCHYDVQPPLDEKAWKTPRSSCASATGAGTAAAPPTARATSSCT